MTRKNDSGFSLIELLIVVALIGILSSVAIPQYRNYTQDTAERACLQDVRTYAGILATEVAFAQAVSAPQDVLLGDGACTSISLRADANWASPEVPLAEAASGQWVLGLPDHGSAEPQAVQF